MFGLSLKTILIIGFVVFLIITFICTWHAMKSAEEVDPNDETFLK